MISTIFQFCLFQPLVQTPEVQPLSQFGGGTCHSRICSAMIVLAVLPHQFFSCEGGIHLASFPSGPPSFFSLISVDSSGSDAHQSLASLSLPQNVVLGVQQCEEISCLYMRDLISFFSQFIIPAGYLIVTICLATVRTILYTVTVSLVIDPILHTFFHTVFPSLQDFLLPYAQLFSTHYWTNFLFLTLPGPSHPILVIWLTELCQSPLDLIQFQRVQQSHVTLSQSAIMVYIIFQTLLYAKRSFCVFAMAVATINHFMCHLGLESKQAVALETNLLHGHLLSSAGPSAAIGLACLQFCRSLPAVGSS